jgi:tetratricopeptide (TPR) repeat protein
MNFPRPGLLAPAIVIGLFAAALPVPLAPEAAGDPAGQCLTAADSDPGSPRADVALLERCSALYPGDVELLAELGAGYEAASPTRAEATYRQVLVLDPEHAEVRVRLARLLLRRGAAAEAVREAEAALRVQPNRQAILDVIKNAENAENARRAEGGADR